MDWDSSCRWAGANFNQEIGIVRGGERGDDTFRLYIYMPKAWDLKESRGLGVHVSIIRNLRNLLDLMIENDGNPALTVCSPGTVGRVARALSSSTLSLECRLGPVKARTGRCGFRLGAWLNHVPYTAQGSSPVTQLTPPPPPPPTRHGAVYTAFRL